MPSLPLRIAILECDTPLENTRAKYGGYGGVFTALLKAGADALNYPGLSSSSGLDLSTWDVVTAQSYPPSLDDIDAILLTGSKHNSFDNDPWILKLVDFVKRVLDQRRVRIIGVCFGHQILGRALGAKVARSEEGWEISVTGMDLTKKGQELFGRTSLALHQMHRDIVYDYPEGVEPLASTAKCLIQAMYIPKRYISVQGHPEFTEEIMREIVKSRHSTGLFTDEMEKDAIERVDRYQDGVVVSQAFLKFLLEE
ncbi:class I glutamine amidotransferase-like protein [Leptodontidium sp. MPI-SDFR-AT-0119]|nr:class I glutamine amidotransferase-like protein [Leptodontidium sp. MPI-SDFR-AT-0119]